MFRTLALSLILLSATPAESKPYKDGCSFGISTYYRTLFKRPPVWESCCDQHDRDYEKGGSWLDREKADLRLAACITQTGFPDIALFTTLGLTIGGGRYWRLR